MQARAGADMKELMLPHVYDVFQDTKGTVGEVKSLTAKMATVRLDDGDEVRVYQNSLQAKAVAATLPFGRRSEAAEAAEPLKFKVAW
eukprot:Skav217295  [mRNA]  locus=scaffold1466:147772:151321:+ [translate_table: standard]